MQDDQKAWVEKKPKIEPRNGLEEKDINSRPFIDHIVIDGLIYDATDLPIEIVSSGEGDID